MESKTWWKGITYPERIDYVGFQNNELVFVLAIEKLLSLEVPEKATWMRMLLCELNRIHSHLVYLGTGALELGAISMFWYCFRERDLVLDLFEMVAGTRMHTRYFQVGGLAEDIPLGFYEETRKFCERMPKAVDEYEAIRLADLEGLYQEQAAARMNISRQTFGRIIETARRKVADVLVNGKVLRIAGGSVSMKATEPIRCPHCRRAMGADCGKQNETGCPHCRKHA